MCSTESLPALGRLIAQEMGRPLAAAVDEIKKCARGCRFYEEHAAAFLADERIATDATAQLRPLRAARRRSSR